MDKNLEMAVRDIRKYNLDVKARDLAIATDPPPGEFLNWIADRLVYVHGESPNVDFVLALRRMATKFLQLDLTTGTSYNNL